MANRQDENGFELRQVRVRLSLEEDDPIYGSETINSPAQAVAVMAKMMSRLPTEHVCVVNLDAEKHPLSYSIVGVGNVDNALFAAQNLFKAAIISNASCILALHNHVGGCVTPSSYDVETTQKLIEAGNILGIPLLDHVIVAAGTGNYYSFMSERPEMFGAHGAMITEM